MRYPLTEAEEALHGLSTDKPASWKPPRSNRDSPRAMDGAAHTPRRILRLAGASTGVPHPGVPMLRSVFARSAIAAATFAVSAAASAVTLPKAAVTAGYEDLAPFSQRLDITMNSGFGNGTFTVPAGVRLVIDYISADIGYNVGGNVLFDVATSLNGAEVESHLPVIPNGVILGQQVWSVSSTTRIYADAGSTVTIALLGSGSGSGGSIVGVYGHFVPAN